MVGDLRLPDAETPDEVADREFGSATEETEDAKASGISERSEVLGEEVDPDRSDGKTEWSGSIHVAIGQCIRQFCYHTPSHSLKPGINIASGSVRISVH